jgi:hypothetical protein
MNFKSLPFSWRDKKGVIHLISEMSNQQLSNVLLYDERLTEDERMALKLQLQKRANDLFTLGNQNG